MSWKWTLRELDICESFSKLLVSAFCALQSSLELICGQ